MTSLYFPSGKRSIIQLMFSSQYDFVLISLSSDTSGASSQFFLYSAINEENASFSPLYSFVINARFFICSSENFLWALSTCVNTLRASINKTSFFFVLFLFDLSKNHNVAGNVTEENMFEGKVTIWLTIPSSIIFFLISYSDPPASEAEFAITKAALPFSFSEVAKCPIHK